MKIAFANQADKKIRYKVHELEDGYIYHTVNRASLEVETNEIVICFGDYVLHIQDDHLSMGSKDDWSKHQLFEISDHQYLDIKLLP